VTHYSPTAPNKPAEPYKSELAKAVEAATAERPCKIFPVSGLLGLAGAPIRKLAIRVNVKSEEDEALVKAHRYVIGLAGDLESVKRDGDILSDAKARHALFEACREVVTTQGPDGEEDKVTKWPAFPGPEWMTEHLTTDQIASLLHLYNQVRAEQAGWLEDFSEETVEDMLMVAAEAGEKNAIARAGLSQLPREQLQFLLERCAVKLRMARADRDMLVKIDAAPAPEQPAS
jgi:hypothetical protein